MFYTDVAKVNWDVAYVAMVVHVFCKFPNISSVFFRRMLQMCLSGCCICFTHILHVFYLDVAYICKGFQVFSTFKCIISDENLDIVIIFNIF